MRQSEVSISSIFLTPSWSIMDVNNHYWRFLQETNRLLYSNSFSTSLQQLLPALLCLLHQLHSNFSITTPSALFYSHSCITSLRARSPPSALNYSHSFSTFLQQLLPHFKLRDYFKHFSTATLSALLYINSFLHFYPATLWTCLYINSFQHFSTATPSALLYISSFNHFSTATLSTLLYINSFQHFSKATPS
jgi:hypothetical protein